MTGKKNCVNKRCVEGVNSLRLEYLQLNLVEKPISFVFFKYNEAYSDHAYDIS